MRTIRVVTDLNECKRLWQATMPTGLVSDLWEVRSCFQNTYNWKPHFIVCEENGQTIGLLPLNFNEETDSYQFFPGESWQGKTWLEQNRIPAKDADAMQMMFAAVDGSFCVRYLRPDSFPGISDCLVDEIGYLFEPEKYGYDIDNYYAVFSGKSAKRLKAELASWDERKVEYRSDMFADFELLIEMNLKRYGDYSYFADCRFADGFRGLVSLLREHDWLRMTTILVDGVVAAVDMGCLYGKDYTLMAGGTNADFPGIAKLINMHHMKFACDMRLETVDFLCGDFNWKTQFHLTPRPLYQITGDSSFAVRPAISLSSVSQSESPLGAVHAG